MTRTPLPVIHAMAAAWSAGEKAFETNSSALGAMSTINSATAVPWVVPAQSAKLGEALPRLKKHRAWTETGSSEPWRAANPSKPPSRMPTFTPLPVKSACSTPSHRELRARAQ